MPLRPALAASLVLPVILSFAACSSDDAEPGEASGSASATASAATSGDAVTTLVDTGLAQLQSGDTAAAEGTFRSVLALDPTNLYASYNLGFIAQEAGQDRRAQDYYDQALTTDPDYAPALYNRAILQEAQDLDGAIEAYRRVVEIDPTFAAAFVRLGFALVHQGKTDEGEALVEKGIDLDPSLAGIDAPTYSER